MAQPPSFYGQGPRIARLPQPVDSEAPLREGVGALAGAAARAQQTLQESDRRVAEMDLQTRRIERDRELQRRTGDRARALAEAHGQLLVDLTRMRAEADAGAEGHEQRVEERIATFRDDFMGSLGDDPDLIDRFADNVATFAASAHVGEVQYAAKARAEKGVADLDTMRATLANSLQTKAQAGELAGADLAAAEGLLRTAIEAQPLPGNVHDELFAKGRVQLHVSAALGAMEVNPAGVVEQADKGAFDWMPEDVRNQVRAKAQALLDKRTREAESAASEGAKVQRAEARVMIEQVAEGVAVDDGRLQSALAIASASKDPEDIALAHDLNVALAKNLTTGTYDKASNAERQAAMRAIEATKDWQKDEKLVAAHSQLGVLIQRDNREARADPLTLYVRQSGQSPGEASIADPASMAGRFTIGDRVADRYPGTPPTHLFEAEAQQLRDQWNTGTPHTRADFIQTIGLYGPRRGRELMRQIAPNKPEYARLVELASFRDPAIKGVVREALDGWAQPPSKAVDSGKMAAETNRLYGAALARIPGDRRGALIQVATGIYSHRAAQGGRTAFDRELWQESLAAALGGSAGRGGFGKAANGDTMVLPAGLSQGDFDTVLRAAETRELIAAAGGQGAMWGNGKALTRGDFMRLTPVLVSDSGAQALYVLRARDGGTVRRADGSGDWVFDVRALARLMSERRGR